ncbi:MAG: hypothetical protein ABI334_03045 [Candidatus Dormiibacterota bacterium]
MLVYTGGGMPATEAERGKVMEAWDAWFGTLGDRVVDAGNPFGQHVKNVSNGGAVHDGAIGTAATGYIAERGGGRGRGLPRAHVRRQDHGLRSHAGDVERHGWGPAAPVLDPGLSALGQATGGNRARPGSRACS